MAERDLQKALRRSIQGLAITAVILLLAGLSRVTCTAGLLLSGLVHVVFHATAAVLASSCHAVLVHACGYAPLIEGLVRVSPSAWAALLATAATV